jgi:Protein of unknown function (DUF3149)
MALNELLTTDIGLLSLFTIGFVLAMGVYLWDYTRKHMAEDARNAK